MLKLNPISESEATGNVKEIFADIKSVFDIDFVPLYFQTAAAVPAFLEELWTQLRPLVNSEGFANLLSTVSELTIDAAEKLVPQDPTISLLVTKLPEASIESHRHEFHEMQRINLIFLSVAIITREAIKGFAMISDNRPHFKMTSPVEMIHEKEIEKLSQDSDEPRNLTVFPNLPAISTSSSDPYFLAYFKLVADHMEKFAKTHDYLSLRLSLENKVQLEMRQMSVKLILPYGKILEILQNHAEANEMIYLLHEAFPSYFPKQFLSSVVLETCLSMKTPNQIRAEPSPLGKMSESNSLSIEEKTAEEKE